MNVDEDRAGIPSRQLRFQFRRDGPVLPMATLRECQVLVARLLEEVLRAESVAGQQRSQDEREDQG